MAFAATFDHRRMRAPGDEPEDQGSGSHKRARNDILRPRESDAVIDLTLLDEADVPAPQAAASTAPSRTGDGWGASQFEGYVRKLPPRKTGQLMVLSQILSKEAAAEYIRELGAWLKHCHKEQLVKLQPLQLVDMSQAERNLASKNMFDWITLHLQRSTAAKSRNNSLQEAREFLTSLPEDPQVHGRVKVYRIPQDDPRVGLRGSLGCRMSPSTYGQPSKLLSKWDVVGTYRANCMHIKEYQDYRCKPHADYPHSRQEWKASCESYGTDLIVESTVGLHTEGADVHSHSIVASAFTVGNKTSLINDSALDPMSVPYKNSGANCRICIYQVGPWSYPMVVAMKDIYEGEELTLEYGHEYWETYTEHQLEFAAAEEERASLRAAHHAAIARMEAKHSAAVRELEAGLAQSSNSGAARSSAESDDTTMVHARLEAQDLSHKLTEVQNLLVKERREHEDSIKRLQAEHARAAAHTLEEQKSDRRTLRVMEKRWQQLQLQVESLQAENEAHIEARNFEAARCRKFEAFLKADAEELAQREKQLPWTRKNSKPNSSRGGGAERTPEGESRMKRVFSSTVETASR